MKKILVTRRLIKDSEDKATKIFEAILNSNDELYSQEKVIEMSKECWLAPEPPVPRTSNPSMTAA